MKVTVNSAKFVQRQLCTHIVDIFFFFLKVLWQNYFVSDLLKVRCTGVINENGKVALDRSLGACTTKEVAPGALM